MKISQIGTQKFSNSSKIGQYVANAGNKFVNGCVDFAISAQDKMGDLSYIDETRVGKLVEKVSKSSSLQAFTDATVNTFKILGKVLVESVKSMVTK